MASISPDKVRVNTYMHQELVEKLDAFADENGLSRNAAISFALNQYFTQLKAVDVLAQMTALIQEAKTGMLQQD